MIVIYKSVFTNYHIIFNYKKISIQYCPYLNTFKVYKSTYERTYINFILEDKNGILDVSL